MKPYFLMIMLSMVFSATAQKVKVQGQVLDQQGNPLELANVVAAIESDGGIADYAVTDVDGEFSLDLPPDAKYSLTASFLGLKPLTIALDLKSTAIPEPLVFNLEPDENQLSDVELVYQLPIVVRGDTIVYDTDSFVNGEEKKLGDVLKKLPGVTVTEEGEIEVDGKKVSKVMVEGKDFFDGDSKLATKNIPADALSKIEVLRNFSEVEQMKGLGSGEENIAVNVKLKEGKKNFWFGSLEAAGGFGEGLRYLADEQLFYYSPNTSLNILGNSNNIGEVPFSYRDYLNFTGGMRVGSSENSELSFLTEQNERVRESTVHFGAINFNQKLSETVNLSGFGIYSGNANTYQQDAALHYFGTDALEFTSSQLDQKGDLGMIKLGTIYKPGADFQLDYDLMAKFSSLEKSSILTSSLSQEKESTENLVRENEEIQPLSVNQNLSAYYTLNKDHVFAGTLNLLYQKENPEYAAALSSPVFPELFPWNEQEPFGFEQLERFENTDLEFQLDHYYILNELNHLNFRIGASLSNTQLQSTIALKTQQGNNQLQNGIFSNNLDRKFADLFAGAGFKFKTGIWTFNPGLEWHLFSADLEQLDQNNTSRNSMLLPTLSVQAQLRNTESLRFNYRVTEAFPDITDFAEAYLIENYNMLSRGYSQLDHSLVHSYSLRYFNLNMYNFTSINAGINYTRRTDAIQNAISIENVDQILTRMNNPDPVELYSLNGNFQKTLRKLILNASANLSLNHFDLYINEAQLKTQSFEQNYLISLQSNLKNGPNLELGYNKQFSDYTSGASENMFTTDRIFLNLQLDLIKNLRLESDFNYYDYSSVDDSIKNKYSFLNATMAYAEPDKNWEIGLRGLNLLDAKTISLDVFEENYSMSTKYAVLPRMILLSFEYSF